MLFRISHALLWLGVALVSATAQPVPRLNSISREWIQRGVQTQVTVAGENLNNVTNVLVSGAPGISASIVPAASAPLQVESSAGGIASIVRMDGKSILIDLSIDANAALTEREIRVVSPEGVSNPLSLRVSPWPEVRSSGNHTRESAQKLELPVAISGEIEAATQSDFFLFSARKGEHVVAEVYAYRLGSRLDSSLAVLEKSGKELARNEDAVGLDSVIDFNPPEDGEYVLELRDFRYQGGSEYKYRMIVGVLPHVNRAFPFGGQRGQTVDLLLEGVNLDSRKLTLSLAPDAPLGRQEIRASSAHGLSNPFPFEVTDLPEVEESEPNTALDQADRLMIPGAVRGKIGKKKDYDAFRFQATADQRIIFEIGAFRFGSRLDALLTLTDATGQVLQRNDDAAGEDARIDYTFKSGGEYFILVEDLLGRGGEEFGYRLTAESPAPDFSVTLLRDAARVRRAGRLPVRCEVTRLNGFDESVIVGCNQLPPGVYAEPLVLPPGVNSGFLVLNATAEAPLGSYPLKVAGRATLKGRTVVRAAEAINEKPAKEAYLTVLEAAPFAVSPATLTAIVEQNQSGNIDVVVERRNGFSGEIRVTAEGFSAGREPITRSFEVQPLTLKGTETRGALVLKTKLDAEIGIRPIVLRAEADPGLVEYSAILPIGTTQLPFVLSTSLKKLVVTALPASSGSAASEAVFNAKVERRGFDEAVELKLEGVPEGMTATVTNIAAKASESTVRLLATEKTPTGTNFQITLTGIGQHNDRVYRFKAPPITLTINAPEAEEKKQPELANKQ